MNEELKTQTLTFEPWLNKEIKSTKANILYWYIRSKTNSTGQIHMDSNHLVDFVGLTYKEQLSCRKRLVSLGLIKEVYKRLEHKLIFIIDQECNDKFIEFRSSHLRSKQTGDSNV